MCLIILKTPEGNITKDILKQVFIDNPDGVGFAYTNYNHIVVAKRLYKKNEFKTFYIHYKEFEKKTRDTNSNLLIHFRYATHGKISPDMCHPFEIYNGLVFAHNGVIFGNEYKSDLVSDTYLYNKKVFQQLPKDFYLNKGTINLIKKDVGTHNKFVFLDKNNRYTIINEDKGQWLNGCWYSYPQYYKTYKEYKKGFYNDGMSERWKFISLSSRTLKK